MGHLTQDQEFMQVALQCAWQGRGLCSPNPAVGAVVVRNGEIVGRGTHWRAGADHAEVVALDDAGDAAQGADLYVTLEPCCHWGRTPPCTGRIVSAGIARVYYGAKDTASHVDGGGVAQLSQAGVLCTPVYLESISRFYASYRHCLSTGRPWVRAKIAMSVDGYIATVDGQPVALTGEALSRVTHAYRRISDIVITTAETIKNDDPLLTARFGHEVVAKPVGIIDRLLQVSPEARVFEQAASVTLYHSLSCEAEQVALWSQRGVRCVAVPDVPAGLDLSAIVRDGSDQGWHDIWVEVGGCCLSSFLQQRLLDSLLVYRAPQALGAGRLAFPKGGEPNDLTWSSMGPDQWADLSFCQDASITALDVLPCV